MIKPFSSQILIIMSMPRILRQSRHPFATFLAFLGALTILAFIFSNSSEVQHVQETHVPAVFQYNGKPVCKEVDRDWIDVIDKQPQKITSLVMNKDNAIYKTIREGYTKFVRGDKEKCFTSLDPTMVNGRFFQQLFDFYGSHSSYCPFKVRLGGLDDGGKWLCDITPCNRCLIYSLGSGEHFEFEKAAKQYYGCEIHTFDCTTTGAKTPPSINFHPWCIGSKDELISDQQYYTLTTIMKKLNHTYMDILKMDIERYEYMVVETLLSLSKNLLPKQIAFEIHLNPMNGFVDYVSFEQFEKLWDRLHGMGYKAISHDVNPVDQCCWDFTLVRSS